MATLRVTQQNVEVIGQCLNNTLRTSNQYVEVIGGITDPNLHVSNQYVEVISSDPITKVRPGNRALCNMVRTVLYSLKRQYGGSGILCSLIDAKTDHRTGKKVVQFKTCPIRRMIVLPSRMTRNVVASVARISVNKPLAYGGQFNIGDRRFIIDGTDLPDDWEIRKDDWIVHRGERYSIKTILHVHCRAGWVIVARKHPGTKFAFDLSGASRLGITDSGAST